MTYIHCAVNIIIIIIKAEDTWSIKRWVFLLFTFMCYWF